MASLGAIVAVLGALLAWPGSTGGHSGPAQLYMAGDGGNVPVASSSTAASSSRDIPAEPAEYDRRELKAFYDWRNDLFFREFDMHGTGRADFMTARRTYRVWFSEFGNPIALTMGNPLFYWVDINNNGKFESHLGEMWSDPQEDGVNGNERLYDVTDLQSSAPPAYPFSR